MLVFTERGKPENSEKNPQSREETNTNSIHLWRQNLGHIGGRQVLSPLRQPCFPVLCAARACRAVVLGDMYCFVLLALPALLHKLPFRVLGAFEGSSADARRVQEPFSQTMQCNVSACWKTRRNPLRKHTRVYFGHLHHQHRACGKENKVKSLLRA